MEPARSSLRYRRWRPTPSSEIPAGTSWQYEPKWDGFRCLAFRDGDEVELQSKAGQPLARYFPDVVEALRALARAALRPGRRDRRPRRRLALVRRAAAAHPPGREPRPQAGAEHPASSSSSTCSLDAERRAAGRPRRWSERRGEARGVRGAVLRARTAPIRLSPRHGRPARGAALARRGGGGARRRHRQAARRCPTAPASARRW